MFLAEVKGLDELERKLKPRMCSWMPDGQINDTQKYGRRLDANHDEEGEGRQSRDI